MVILADSSAWMEYLRRTGSAVHLRLRAQITAGKIVTCDPVRMEVLAGARDEGHLAELTRMLDWPEQLTVGPNDYDHAAYLYRACRRRGATVRSLFDCLIAAIAITADVPVLHADRDFDALARHTRLQVV